MGKARIIEALGEGHYTIEVVEARERAESAKQQAEARITSLQNQIVELQGDLPAAQQAVDVAAADQNTAIAQYQADMAAKGESSVNLEAASRAVLEAVSARDQIAVQINVAQVRIKSDEALIARVNALPPLRQMQAWCADYTNDLSGEVATAEVPGEIGKVIIKPSFEGSAWSAINDGAMQPAFASTPAGAFYNLAMMPGWQKWRPTYRTATITSIDGDACDISLDAESSSQQGLNVNVYSSYSGVPILYMDCNGEAFEQGDKVLIAFSGNVNEPVVCGFESGPKQCSVCDVRVLDNRIIDNGEEWLVRNEWAGQIIDRVGTQGSEWRIINSNGDTIYDGSIVPEPDTLNAGTLDGLPYSIVVPAEPVDGVWTMIGSEVTRIDGRSFDLTPFQSRLYPGYAYGSWRLRETGSGGNYGSESISSHGNLNELPSVFESTYPYDGYMELQIRPPDGYEGEGDGEEPESYTLEIGCQDRDTGEIQWPQ